MCRGTHAHVHALAHTQYITQTRCSPVILQEDWQGNPSPLHGAVYSRKAWWTQDKCRAWNTVQVGIQASAHICAHRHKPTIIGINWYFFEIFILVNKKLRIVQRNRCGDGGVDVVAIYEWSHIGSIYVCGKSMTYRVQWRLKISKITHLFWIIRSYCLLILKAFSFTWYSSSEFLLIRL